MDKRENRKGVLLRAGQVMVWTCLVCLCLFSAESAAAQVSLLLSSGADPYLEATDGLKKALGEEGIRPRVLLLENLPAAPTLSKGSQAEEVWVAIGSRAAAYLNSHLPKTASLVYCMVVDPKNIGLGAGGRKVAGVSLSKPVREQFAIISKALPELHSIGMLYRSSSSRSVKALAGVRENLPDDWQLAAIDVDTFDSMAEAIRELFRHPVGMVWTMADSALYNRATVKGLLLASLRNRVPVFGFSASFVKAGALLGIDADPGLQGRYAASLVLDALGRSSRDSTDLSVGVTFAVNMVVAQRLGISLPGELVEQSTVVGGRP